jgi:hypothetical protein
MRSEIIHEADSSGETGVRYGWLPARLTIDKAKARVFDWRLTPGLRCAARNRGFAGPLCLTAQALSSV